MAIIFNTNIEITRKLIKVFPRCEGIYGHSIIYSKIKDNYYLISDITINNIRNPLYILIIKPDILNISNSNYSISDKTNDCLGLEKCQTCNNESLDNNLCISCNAEKEYYPLNEENYKNNTNYIDCVNNETRPHNFCFNEEKQYYEKCYEVYKTYELEGKEENEFEFNNNNSITLSQYYDSFETDIINSTKFILNCTYFKITILLVINISVLSIPYFL